MDNSVSAGDSVFSKISGTYINQNTNVTDESDTTSNYLDFDDYLQLIVAQMQNQDFNDPMDDSEIISTMSQYSMLEGIKNMTQQSAISYASSLVGKVVTVDDGSGAYTGMVESVNVSNGTAYLMIDGQQYKSDKVTDIVDENTFNNLMSLIGYTVKKRGADDSEAIGQVTNILYSGGTSYVVAGGELYPISSVQLVSTEVPGAETSESGDGSGEGEETGTGDDEGVRSDGVGSADGTGSVDGAAAGADGTDGGDETLEEIVTIESVETAASYVTMTDSLIETYMNELDGISGVSETSGASETALDSYDEYVVEIGQIQVQDYAAGVFADSEMLTSDTLYADGADGEDGSLTRDYADVELETSYSVSVSDPDTAERTSSGKLKGVTTAKGVSTSDCVPHRISVEDYPEEAALADELGTRMYDIRFINNHAVTSRIKTDQVIGHTSSGKAITEIGYSGVGQLGEVVTFQDGTQRVEVLLKNGHSVWLNTSGNLTLDEICTRDGEPGSLTGKLTPEESAIRHYSRPMDGEDQSLRNSFANSI